MYKDIRLCLLTPVLILANPFIAHAEDKPIALDISGHVKMYGNYVDQDGNVNDFDIQRDTDVTLSGETTRDNGQTFGVVVNADGDGEDSFDIEDSYIFTSGAWGRLSAGVEDGAAFMLQVATPAADENVDGIEPFITPLKLSATALSGTDFADNIDTNFLTYGNYLTTGADKITYVTPMLAGFQAAASFTPDVANFSPASRNAGNGSDNTLDEFGQAWEAAIRYENGVSETLKYTTGAGYTSVDAEETNGASTVDTYTQWNVGLDVDYGAFGVGVAYTEDNGGVKENNDSDTFVVGVDYTMGAVKYGASWLTRTHEESATEEVDADRYAIGATYESAQD